MSDARQGVIGRMIGGMNLRFPTLFAIFAAVTLADLVIPDLVPFVDEIGLALITALFGMWRNRRVRSAEPS